MLKKVTTLMALLVLLTLLAAPLVLAQQDGGEGSLEGVSQAPAYDTVSAVPVGMNSDGSVVDNANAGFLQYSVEPSPVVPPGYQRIGDYYCPTFDPHGPPCFRVP